MNDHTLRHLTDERLHQRVVEAGHERLAAQFRSRRPRRIRRAPMQRRLATSWPSDVMRRSEMRAIVHDRYGPPEVLRVDEVERPVPKDDEVLVRVHATTVTRTDCHMRARDRSSGASCSACGDRGGGSSGSSSPAWSRRSVPPLRDFAVGDRVFGLAQRLPCRVRLRARAGPLTPIPAGVTFEEAAGPYATG